MICWHKSLHSRRFHVLQQFRSNKKSCIFFFTSFSSKEGRERERKGEAGDRMTIYSCYNRSD